MSTWRPSHPASQRNLRPVGWVARNGLPWRRNWALLTAYHGGGAQQRCKQSLGCTPWRTLPWVLGKAASRILWYSGMSPKCGLVQRTYPKTDLSVARKWKEEEVRVPGDGRRARHIHNNPRFYHYRGGMANECLRCHSRLAELIAAKKQETYSTTISWIRAKVSFAILRSALLCIRGSRAKRRRSADVKENQLDWTERYLLLIFHCLSIFY